MLIVAPSLALTLYLQLACQPDTVLLIGFHHDPVDFMRHVCAMH
jgi:hypothetical protein